MRPPGGWVDDALCALPENRNLAWFPEDDERGRARDEARRKVRRVCARCPVQRECLTYARDAGATAGIWAGILFTRAR